MNLRTLAEIIAAAESVAVAARREFKAEALRRYEEDEMAPGGKTPDGTLTFTSSFARTGLAIQDRQKFLAYLKPLHPDEVVERLDVINPAWLEKTREIIAAAVSVGEMDAPPGTQLVEGGSYLGTSLTVDKTLKYRLSSLAQSLLSVEAESVTGLTRLVQAAAEMDEE